jgi:hypothetical protein
VFGGVLLFHPGWVVSLALAGLASGFGMGPGVSLPLWTAVTLFTFSVFPCGEVLLVAGCGAVNCGLWLRVLWVSFRPVSASSLNPLLGV